MRVDELTVEVRDGDLERVGQIPADLLDVQFVVRWCAPGSWTVRLPAEHPLAEVLTQPQAGIVVSHATGGVVLSGRRVRWVVEASPADPDGVLVAEGVTDDEVLWARLAYPTPATDSLAGQGSYYTDTGPAESVFRRLVDRNLGPSAPAARRVAGLSLAADQARGESVQVSARFQQVGDVLAGLSGAAGVGFRVVQDGSGLTYEPLIPRDQTDTVRLDVQNGTLASQQTEVVAPSVSRAVVAGQGEGSARTLIERVNAGAEAAWGRWGRVERFFDQRQTDDQSELEQRGDEALLEGAGGAVLAVVPGSDQTMRWPDDWTVGDLVAVVVTDGPDVVELPTRVQSVTVVAGRDGVAVGAGVDDPPPVSSLESRVQALEASVGAPVVRSYTPTLGNVTLGNGTVSGWWQQVGGVVTATIMLTCGSSTSFTGSVRFGLPVGAASFADVTGVGHRVTGGTRGLWVRADNGSNVLAYTTDDNSLVNAGHAISNGTTFVLTVTYRI